MKQPNCKVWTPQPVVQMMLELLQPNGRVLEPSAGTGAFMQHLPPTAVGVELDGSLISDKRVIIGDFFDYPLTEKFNHVIMNPPYLRAKHIQPSVKLIANLTGHANLAYHFVWKCMDHLLPNGSLVAILPEEMFRATGAAELNTKMYDEGTITHVFKFRKSPFLPAVSQEAMVIRWEKDLFSHQTEVATIE